MDLLHGISTLRLIIYLIIFLLILIVHKKIIFCISVLYMFLIFPLYTFVYPHDIERHRHFSDHIRWFFNAKLMKLPGSKPLYCTRENKTIVLLNHRSWGDFFIHDALTEYTCSILTRLLVVLIFPFLWLATASYNSLWVFRRKTRPKTMSSELKKLEIEKFFLWIDEQFTRRITSRRSLIVYPEGHRNITLDPIPLKTGFIRYSYARKNAIQIIIAFGLANMISEKKLKINFQNNKVVYYIGDVLFPSEYPTYSEYEKKVTKIFEETFYYVRNHELSPIKKDKLSKID